MSAAHALGLLEHAHGAPLTIRDLKRRGVALPAHAIYELLLAGHAIDRVPMRDGSGNAAMGYRLRR